MARQSAYERFGNEIYLTDERWAHIIKTHDEMRQYREHVSETLRTGKPSQDVFDPSKYKYVKEFLDLLDEFTHVVVTHEPLKRLLTCLDEKEFRFQVIEPKLIQAARSKE